MRRPTLFTLVPTYSDKGFLKGSYLAFSNIFTAILRTPKAPVNSLEQALFAWGLDGFTSAEIAGYQKKRLYSGILGGTLFCFLAFLFFLNFWHGKLGILPCLEYGLAAFAILSVTLICLWQSDVLSDGAFIPFTEYIRKCRWLFSVFLFISLCSLDQTAFVVAEGLEVPLPDLTVANKEDLSSRFLNSLVGEPWKEFAPGVGDSLPMFSSVLIPILTCLNSIALFFITTFAIYIFTFGTTQIAHTGKWSDSQIFSTFWSPLRTCAAIALCTPFGQGVSLMQHLILVAIAVSINLANNVTTTCITFMQSETNLMHMVVPKVNFYKDHYSQLFTTVSQVALTQKLITNIHGDDIYFAESLAAIEPSKSPYTISTSDDSITISFDAPKNIKFPQIVIRAEEGRTYHNEKTSYEYVGSGSSITYIEHKTGGQKEAVAQYAEAIEAMFAKIYELAEKMAAKNLEDRNKLTEADFVTYIKDAKDDFTKKVNNVITTIQTQSESEGQMAAKAIKERMVSGNSKYGWVLFGIYPFAVAQAQSGLQANGDFSIDMSGGSSSDEIQKYLTTKLGKNESLEVADAYMKKLTNAVNSLREKFNDNYGFEETNLSASNIGRKIMGWAGLDLKEVIEEFKTKNPVAVMYSKGWEIVKYSCYAVTAIGLGKGLIAGIADVAGLKNTLKDKKIPDILGNSRIFKGLVGVTTTWMPFLLGIIMLLITFGISCCYLLPALPMIYWARALVSWAILLVQTLMGAPFWAAAHVFPEGIGLAGQHARRGYLMLMDVFMRPTLLCCGVIMSMLLLETIVKVLANILDFWITATTSVNNMDLGMGVISYVVTCIVAIYIIYATMKYLYVEVLGNFPHQVLVWCGGNDIPESRLEIGKSEQNVVDRMNDVSQNMSGQAKNMRSLSQKLSLNK